ncbi:MAG: hypothetical protein ABI761_05180 [Saprospiraceae bacterium]
MGKTPPVFNLMKTPPVFVINQISILHSNFAKTGNPNGSGLPTWKPYESMKEPVLIIDKVIESKPLPSKEQNEFLGSVF